MLATVKGDVHDIGKNLVDIILTNNGYTVVNLGIKQPIHNIVEVALRSGRDAIGMSGLLVKSTLIMRDNLEEMNARGLSRFPVILGGAALTRATSRMTSSMYRGDVCYAGDAFEGLRLMDAVMLAKRGEIAPEVAAEQELKAAERKARHQRSRLIRGAPPSSCRGSARVGRHHPLRCGRQ